MSDTVTFHRLAEQNAELLSDADVFDHATDPAQLARFVADPGHEMVVATIGGKVIGFASGTLLLHPDKKPAFFVNEVGVNEGFRQRGIATALCNHVMPVTVADESARRPNVADSEGTINQKLKIAASCVIDKQTITDRILVNDRFVSGRSGAGVVPE